MSQIEQQISNRGRTQQNSGAGSQGQLLVNVRCDGQRVQLGFAGHETVADAKRQALDQMQVLSANPEKYIVIGANRQPSSIARHLGKGSAVKFSPDSTGRLWASTFGEVRCRTHCSPSWNLNLTTKTVRK
jgi:hypothetical protein